MRPRRKGGKLDIERVRQIRIFYDQEKTECVQQRLKLIRKLAAKFKVSTQTINLVVKNKIWNDDGDHGEEMKIEICVARMVRWRFRSGMYTVERIAAEMKLSPITVQKIIDDKILKEAVPKPWRTSA
jgi:hypothetical protein